MTREVSMGKMQEGIDLCKSNVSDFLKDARLVIADSRLNHAYVITQFAIEEFGKIVMLKEALASTKTDPLLLKDSIFKSHKEKDEKAWTVLDPKYMIIYDEGAFDDTAFDPKDFETDTKVSHQTRLDCAFVDCEYGEWYLGREIKEKLLLELIQHIEAQLLKV
jgi:AbiV family abortive infection protein